MLGDEWFQSITEEEERTIQALLKKSQDQLSRGEGRTIENLFQESRKKFGI